MVKIYNSVYGELVECSEIVDGVWVNMVLPTEEEIDFVCNKLGTDPDFIKAALDEEERSRIEVDDDNGQVIILVDTPYVQMKEQSKMYETIPIGIILTDLCIVTVSLQPSLILEPFIKNTIKTFYTFKKSRFILQMLYKNAELYLMCLKHIDKQSTLIEESLHKSMKNKEFIQLLTLEKSLVYISTSLKSNEIVMEKLLRYDFIKKYPDDTELLEDTIIENKQAIEMAKIYSDILTGTMDSFASLISNNLNIVMKRLTSITIVMAIPTIISSFFGMNVPVPFASNPFAFVGLIIGSIIICFVVIKYMTNRNMF